MKYNKNWGSVEQERVLAKRKSLGGTLECRIQIQQRV